MSYAAGSVVKLTGTFTDSAGNPIDPSTVKLTVQEPSGTKTTYVYGGGQIVKANPGVYYFLVDTTSKPGVWSYRWFSEGTAQAATTNDHFVIRAASPVTP